MKSLIALFAFIPAVASADDFEARVTRLAQANGYKPSQRVVKAIANAARVYGIRPRDLTAIAIVETGLGRYERTMVNANGTKDVGLFQINEVNHEKCLEYNLESPEGSAMCAAKLLAEIKKRHADFVARYHSKTLKHRLNYGRKISSVFEKAK